MILPSRYNKAGQRPVGQEQGNEENDGALQLGNRERGTVGRWWEPRNGDSSRVTSLLW